MIPIKYQQLHSPVCSTGTICCHVAGGTGAACCSPMVVPQLSGTPLAAPLPTAFGGYLLLHPPQPLQPRVSEGYPPAMPSSSCEATEAPQRTYLTSAQIAAGGGNCEELSGLLLKSQGRVMCCETGIYQLRCPCKRYPEQDSQGSNQQHVHTVQFPFLPLAFRCTRDHGQGMTDVCQRLTAEETLFEFVPSHQ